MITRLLARAQLRHALLNRIAALAAERADLLRQYPDIATRAARRRSRGSSAPADHKESQERSWLDSSRRHWSRAHS